MGQISCPVWHLNGLPPAWPRSKHADAEHKAGQISRPAWPLRGERNYALAVYSCTVVVTAATHKAFVELLSHALNFRSAALLGGGGGAAKAPSTTRRASSVSQVSRHSQVGKSSISRSSRPLPSCRLLSRGESPDGALAAGKIPNPSRHASLEPFPTSVTRLDSLSTGSYIQNANAPPSWVTLVQARRVQQSGLYNQAKPVPR